MDEIGFKIYLSSKQYGKKICSDFVSRLKRLENSISGCDLDAEYKKDKCEHLIRLLKKNGNNEQLKKVLIDYLPIGSYSMSVFRYSVKKYIEFKMEKSHLLE